MRLMYTRLMYASHVRGSCTLCSVTTTLSRGITTQQYHISSLRDFKQRCRLDFLMVFTFECVLIWFYRESWILVYRFIVLLCVQLFKNLIIVIKIFVYKKRDKINKKKINIICWWWPVCLKYSNIYNVLFSVCTISVLNMYFLTKNKPSYRNTLLVNYLVYVQPPQ